MTSPNDHEISAGAPYREQIKQNFDLVLVENGCYLEPNYVIVDGLPSDTDPVKVRDLNKLQ